MDQAVERYFLCGLAPATHKSYDSAKRRFLQFCSRAQLNPLLVTENLLCRYVAHLAEDGLAPKTIKLYLSAVRHLQLSMNLPDPKIGEMARLEQVVKGVKREYTKKAHDTRERLPITPELLIKMKHMWSQNPTKFDHIMLWAACCVCFFAFLRSGEVTVPSDASYDSSVHLNIADIAVDNTANPSMVKIEIKASKTNQFRRGVDIFLGRAYNQLCPVEALMAYVARRGQDPGLLFRFEDHWLLTKDCFVAKVQEALSSVGINAKAYSRHSFRIKAATTAGRKGVSSEKIQALGRWESSAYLLYIRIPWEELASISKVISTGVE